MSRSQASTRLPPGRPPWDAWNGLRVGFFAGGVIGALGLWVAGAESFWLAFVAAAVGGVLGYRSERNKLSTHPQGPRRQAE